jgi:outer membrane protein assembly factor BamD (BamD/ComL family)
MILSDMKTSLRSVRLLAALLVMFVLPLAAQKKKKDEIQKPIAGPRATALRVTWLYVSASTEAQKVDRVQPGRELVVAEKSGDWLRVFANTDVELEHTADEPIFDTSDVPPPISGWMQAKGVVIESTPNGDQVLMGAAADEEAQANDPRGPVNAARSAHLIYRRLAEIFPNSPVAAEAAWRAADISWQIQKADAATRPSAKEQAAYLRQQIDEDQMKHVIRDYPHTKQADYAAFELLDNKLCGDWQGQTKCPEKESEIYEKFAAEHPDGPRTAQALYLAVYRQAVLKDIYAGEENEKKGEAAHAHARDLAARLKDKFPQSDYTARAAMLVFKLDQGIAVYGIDKE